MWLFVPVILLKYSGTRITPWWRPVLCQCNVKYCQSSCHIQTKHHWMQYQSSTLQHIWFQILSYGKVWAGCKRVCYTTKMLSCFPIPIHILTHSLGIKRSIFSSSRVITWHYWWLTGLERRGNCHVRKYIICISVIFHSAKFLWLHSHSLNYNLYTQTTGSSEKDIDRTNYGNCTILQ